MTTLRMQIDEANEAFNELKAAVMEEISRAMAIPVSRIEWMLESLMVKYPKNPLWRATGNGGEESASSGVTQPPNRSRGFLQAERLSGMSGSAVHNDPGLEQRLRDLRNRNALHTSLFRHQNRGSLP